MNTKWDRDICFSHIFFHHLTFTFVDFIIFSISRSSVWRIRASAMSLLIGKLLKLDCFTVMVQRKKSYRKIANNLNGICNGDVLDFTGVDLGEGGGGVPPPPPP